MGPSSHPQVSAERILSTLQAYRGAAALHTAIELELFTRIAHGVDTANRIAAELGVPLPGVRILCNYLVAAGFLIRDGETLQLADDSAIYLDKASPSYLGCAAASIHCPAMVRGFDRLTEAVCGRSDLKDARIPPGWYDFARGVSDRPAALQAFTDAIVLPAGPVKILDVGAGDGAYGIAVASRYPQAIVVAVDQPDALKIAHRNAIEARLGTRYQNIPGDLRSQSFGRGFDAAIAAGSLHELDPSDAELCLKRIRDALNKDGRLFILESVSNESANPADFDLTALIAARRGGVYSLAELKQILHLAGFDRIETQPLPAARATLLTAAMRGTAAQSTD